MTGSFMWELLDTIVDRGRSLIGLPRGTRSGADLTALTQQLLSRRGEASGVALAREILDRLQRADGAIRVEYLVALAREFGADPVRLALAVDAWQRDPSSQCERDLNAAAEPRRQEVIRRLNLAPGGTAALVSLRAELLDALGGHPELEPLDHDFQHLFSSWFNRGFLVLKRIDWNTPASILEKIIQYEAVHEIQDWNDLRNRLQPPDRRCFAFFHPQLGDEPLIFVEVALTPAIPGAIAPLLDLARKPIRPEDATTAVFYSISNCQAGLKGVSFGHFLIKQVVEELKRDLPKLDTFVTLSPVPGFAAWLDRERAQGGPAMLSAAEREALAGLDTAGWHVPADALDKAHAAQHAALLAALTSAAAAYFLLAKTPGGRPLDPVARFHLGNGARLERLNPLGDLSSKGVRQAYGLMVNYLYDLAAIEENHEAYAERGQVVASSAVRRLVKADAPATKPAGSTAPQLPAPASASS